MKNPAVWLQFNLEDLTEKQIKAIWKAEELLGNAGIYFDTGTNASPYFREWSLDWSIEGPLTVVVLEHDEDMPACPKVKIHPNVIMD